jgi:endonuclease/exonuclease/phosphatase family metal-dependent hydrolase
MSAKLILNKIELLNKNDLPLVFMGDLNSEPDSKTIEIISKKLFDGITISKKPFIGSLETITGFSLNTSSNKRIDYIFVKGLSVFSYSHIEDKMKNSNFISDHLPVLISASLSN